MPETTAVATAPRPLFSDFLATVNQGLLNLELTDELEDLVKAINQRADHGVGKPKGEIVLKVKLMLDRGIMEVETDLSVKEPKVVRQRQIMYATAGGQLHRNNPTQFDAFRDVSTAPSAEVRTVSVLR